MTYCAVVKYAVDATDREKIRALTEGLQDVVCEMVCLGCTPDDIEHALEDAGWAGEEEARAIGEAKP